MPPGMAATAGNVHVIPPKTQTRMIRNTLGRLRIPSLILATCALLSACEGSDLPLDTDATSAAAAPPAAVAQASGARVTASAAVATSAISTPVMFVTQVPTAGDIFAGRLAAFANHMTDMTSVPRGGDLMIRYPDGSLRNLTKEAGFGMEGRQGANAIAVREPTVHWDGKCDCGWDSPRIGKTIRRFAENEGGDDKITCAGTAQAYNDFLDFVAEG